jgi:hypothetical protein
MVTTTNAASVYETGNGLRRGDVDDRRLGLARPNESAWRRVTMDRMSLVDMCTHLDASVRSERGDRCVSNVRWSRRPTRRSCTRPATGCGAATLMIAGSNMLGRMNPHGRA